MDVFTACFGKISAPASTRKSDMQQTWGHPGAFQAPGLERDQSSRRKWARAVAIGWARDFCQAVIMTLATRLPWRVKRHSA